MLAPHTIFFPLIPNAVKSYLYNEKKKTAEIVRLWFIWIGDLCSDISHTLDCIRYVCARSPSHASVHRSVKNPTCCFSVFVFRLEKQVWNLARKHWVSEISIWMHAYNDKDHRVIAIASATNSGCNDCLPIVKLANMDGQDLMGFDWHILKIHLFRIQSTVAHGGNGGGGDSDGGSTNELFLLWTHYPRFFCCRI